MLLFGIIVLAVGIAATVLLLTLTVRADRRAAASGGPRISARDNWNLFRANAFRFQDYLDANPGARTRLRLRQGLFGSFALVAAGVMATLIALLRSAVG
jgi:hypothetical protein